MKTLKEQIAVMQAADDGVDIESVSYMNEDDWSKAPVPSWNWFKYNYRVAKPTKPREFWRNYYGDVRSPDHSSKEMADKGAARKRTECVHFREVIKQENNDGT